MKAWNRMAALSAVAFSLIAGAQTVPMQFSFSARVKNAGADLSGSHLVDLRLFEAPAGGNSLWSESHTLQVEGGVLAAALGSSAPLPALIFDGRPLLLEVSIDGTTLSPRMQVTSVPFAVRADTAGVAERLGTLQPGDVALASHSHNGTYLPLSSTLACSGSQKVTGLTAQGAVVCGNDLDVGLAGSGSAATAARSDHTHVGTYVPVNTARCGATQRAVGLNANGSPICEADLNTTYAAGTGLTVSGTTFNVSFGTSGTAASAARSDHGHSYTCPAGYKSHWFSSTAAAEGTRVLCTKPVASVNVTWVEAVRRCALDHGAGRLCTVADLTLARMASTPSHTQESLFANYWLADRGGDNMAFRTNATSGDDFDQESNVNDQLQGFYCCNGGNFFR